MQLLTRLLLQNQQHYKRTKFNMLKGSFSRMVKKVKCVRRKEIAQQRFPLLLYTYRKTRQKYNFVHYDLPVIKEKTRDKK